MILSSRNCCGADHCKRKHTIAPHGMDDSDAVLKFKDRRKL